MSTRKFGTGATRDTDEDKLDYEGFLSPLVLREYEKFIDGERMRAWAAGLFEGEGCITILKAPCRTRKDGTVKNDEGYRYPKLCMSLTDEETIRKFCSIVGGKVRGPYKNKNGNKPIWYWGVCGKNAIHSAKILLPYLNSRRSMRMVEVFGIKDYALLAGIEPSVLQAYGEYMHKHRKQSDGNLRDSDNWQRGMPKSVYMKSLWRHFMDLWLYHRGYPNRDGVRDALNGILFNTMGYYFELLREAKADTCST